MIISTDGINYTWGTYGGGVLPPASVKLHGNITNPSWADTEEFSLAANEETASLTLTNLTKGNYEFGVKIADSWTSNGSAFTRANNSHEIVAGSSGNCTFNADRNGDYTFTWTYATNTLEITYPAVPAQSVALTSIATPMLKGTEVTFEATSTGIDEPGYRFYVKEKNGSYGSAVTSYTFDAIGEFVVKVDALEYNAGDPVASDEQDVVVYDARTFHSGDIIYVDFSAMTEGTKGVNYPKTYEAYLDYDANGAGTLKAITFTADVQWTTFDDFIKTEKGGWAGMKFSVPGAGENCAVVAADGLSYTWTTYVAPPPTIKMHGNFLGEWNTTDAFVLAVNNETASLTLDIQTKGEKEFGMRIGSDDNWTSNGASITRASASAEIVAGSGNCKLNVDAKGEYTFTWTFASNTLAVTYPALPAQSVAFDGLASQVLKGTNVVFAATSSGIDNPGYRFYVREKNGVYGAAVTEYTFNALGEYEVKVEALEDNTGDPVASDVADVVVYQAHTFTTGTVLYVDFTAMTEGVKGVNYPKTYEAYLDYDAAGAGTLKAITFTADVQWTTFDDFIKTEKAGWAGMKFSVPGAGENCAVVAADGLSYTWTTYVAPPPTIKMHGNFLGEWNTTDAFVLAGNNETASLTLDIQTKGEKEFGMRIGSDDNWTSNGASITRASASAEIVAGSGNCKLNVDAKGEYTFTWTFASNTLAVTYPALPAQSVAFDGLASQVLKGTNVVFAATSSGIDNPGYRFYVREKNGVYGAAVTEYTFDALGEYEVKVEALEDNTGDPVASDVADVVVYQAHTFTTGTVLYVDFTAMTEGVKGVNLPYGDQASSLNYIADGAGTLQAVTFTTDVEWSTLNTFIKTEKAGWADLKFRVPENGENCVVVAADGASYTWSTHIPTICLNGTFAGAGWAATADFVLDASGDFATLEMNNLAEGTYEFKAVLDGNNWRGNGATFTRANNSSAMPDNGDNMNFVADVTGDYIFTWTYATNTLSVTYPTPTPPTPTADYSRNVTVGNYGTICLPNGGNISGAKLYDLEYYDGANTLYLLEVNGNAMIAGRPYIFLPSVATIEVTYTDDANEPAGSFNGLVGSYSQEVVAESAGNYILLNNQYWFVNSLAYVGANRAYIHMASVPTTPSQQSGAPRRRVSMNVNNEQVATGIENGELINAENGVQKVLIDGQIFILRGEKMYNVNGQMVK